MLKGADSGNAVATALARLVADGFVLCFLTELSLDASERQPEIAVGGNSNSSARRRQADPSAIIGKVPSDRRRGQTGLHLRHWTSQDFVDASAP